ncbi:protein Mpsnf1.8 [Marchantia polymorpha subsp. ruderalis]|uniref:Uncharacterized protein n=2 Tax=Marchantia polymorpha TaxID=3197 RepID=A0AAF6ARL2_MARPO|nr:hypothetical protein MARPO_0001s0194 [Marchantia polymorpha]BBM99082.1 hypothetical protein Mp_1g18560 [Marchantia polymorpha subsp. ruderalis]|eukprot:PTQ50159.1 hypothetical protein MARPO_0001s0194 [Marchantia polymorpha]
MQLRRRSSHVNYSEAGSPPTQRTRRSNSAVSDDIEDAGVEGASDDVDEEMSEPQDSSGDEPRNSQRRRLSNRKRKRSTSRDPDKDKSHTNTLLVYTKRNVNNNLDRPTIQHSSDDENVEGEGDHDDFVTVKPGRRKRKLHSEPRTREMRARRSEVVNYKDVSSDEDEDVSEIGSGGSAERAKRPGRKPSAGNPRRTSEPEDGDVSPDFAQFAHIKKPINDDTEECATPSGASDESPVKEGGPDDVYKCYTRRLKNKFIVASDEDDEGGDGDRSNKKLRNRSGDNPEEWEEKKRNSVKARRSSDMDVDFQEETDSGAATFKASKHSYDVDSFGLRIDDEYLPVIRRISSADKVEKVLAVRNRSIGEAVYCVKLLGKCYRSVVNVMEEQMLKHCPQLLRGFLKKLDLLKRADGHIGDHQSLPAFNPQYLMVDRIISVERTNRFKRYLVKWCGLPYSEATWERDDQLTDDVNAIKRFYAVNSKNKKIRPAPSSSKLVFNDGRSLRDYQEEGVAWLDNKFTNAVNCILADEMGLGKTIQSVAMLETLRLKHSIDGPYLVIAPVSTLGHWQREIESLTDMNCVVYTGTQDDRAIIREYEFKYEGDRKSSRMKFNVLLTSFEMLMKDQAKLGKIKWQYIIVDEAHRLKSRGSKTTIALRQMNVRKGGLVLLTGTPVQNNTKEIFSLLNLLDSERFASEDEFLEKYGDLRNAEQVKELQESVLRPRLLRRMKEDVEKSIPQKKETIVWVELTREQRIYYRAVYENNVGTLLKGSTSSNVSSLRNVAMELRKVCNHPFLCDGFEEDYASKHGASRRMSVKDGKNVISTQNPLQEASGKMILVDKLLPMLKGMGRRVLIFSQFTMMLDLLEDYLLSKAYTYERIDGNIRGSDRQAAIDRYSAKESNIFVFLLSTRAGGLGITLTAADTCIIYDSDWNPQNDLQAMARCHRIGQTKDVRIYRLITRNTYEQQLFECSSRKYGLDEAILGNRVGADVDVEMNRNIESLLKHGAYDILKDDSDAAAAEFSAQNIHEILEHRTQERLIGGRGVNTFSVATFLTNTEGDPEPAEELKPELEKGSKEFWKDLLPEACKASEVPVEKVQTTPSGSRRKRARTRVDYREDPKAPSDDETPDTGGSFRESQSDESSVSVESEEGDGVGAWSERELKRLEDRLMVLGKDRTMQVRQEAQLEHRHPSQVEQVSEHLIQLCYFIDATKALQAPSPSQKGLEKDAKQPKVEDTNAATIPEQITGTKDAESDGELEMLPLDCLLVNDLETGVNYRKDGYILIGDTRRPVAPVFARKALKSRNFTERIAKNASRYVQVLREREILSNAIQKNDSTYLPPKVPIRSKKIPLWWGPQEDLDLMLGVHKHGHRDYKKVRMDPQFCFAKRMTPTQQTYEQFIASKEGVIMGMNGMSTLQCDPNLDDGGQGGEWPPDIVLAARLKKLIQLLPSGLSSRENKQRSQKPDKKRTTDTTSGNAETRARVAVGADVKVSPAVRPEVSSTGGRVAIQAVDEVSPSAPPAMNSTVGQDAQETDAGRPLQVVGKENEIPPKPSSTPSTSKKQNQSGTGNTKQQSIIGYLSSRVAAGQ